MKQKLKLKTKILLFLGVFSIMFLIVGVLTVMTLQTEVITTAQEKLKGDLAMGRAFLESKIPGDWSVQDGKIFKGETKMNDNFAFVDMVGDLTGDTVTIFQGDTRITTNVKNASGQRAIGTKAAENVIEATLKKGQVYIGKANVVGTWNQTAYEPIRDVKGVIIGMFYVGVPNTKYDNVVNGITMKVAIFSVIGLLIVFALGIFLANSITKPINRVVEGLRDGSHKVVESSEQVAESARQLAEGSSIQAASFEETSSSLEAMSSMTKNNADNARQAKAMAGDALNIVEKVSSHMDGMNKAIDDITKSSSETGKIIKTIDEIAFQTNLLALNAAVEAARAGESGAGFAVVAGEVRNLAMRAAEAAKSTSSLIDDTVKAVQKGSELAKLTESAFEGNIEISKKISQLVDEIAVSSQEQAQGISQINTSMTEMDHVTQRYVVNADESAKASVSMKGQAERMIAYVEDLVAVVNGNGKNGAKNLLSDKAIVGDYGHQKKSQKALPHHRVKNS